MKKTKLLSFMMAFLFLLIGTAVQAQKNPNPALNTSVSAGPVTSNVDFADIDAAAAIIKAEGATNPALDNPNYPANTAETVENILRLKYLEYTLEAYQESGVALSAIGIAYKQVKAAQADFAFEVVDQTWYADMVTLLAL